MAAELSVALYVLVGALVSYFDQRTFCRHLDVHFPTLPPMRLSRTWLVFGAVVWPIILAAAITHRCGVCGRRSGLLSAPAEGAR